MSLFVLFESASGYALFEQTESDEIGELLEEMQNAMADLSRFSKVIKLKAFVPFKAAEEALEAANDISEGILNDGLRSFLEMNLPAAKKDKKPKFSLGVIDSKIGNSISEEMGACIYISALLSVCCKKNKKLVNLIQCLDTGIPCTTKDPVPELIRGIRLHFGSLRYSSCFLTCIYHGNRMYRMSCFRHIEISCYPTSQNFLARSTLRQGARRWGPVPCAARPCTLVLPLQGQVQREQVIALALRTALPLLPRPRSGCSFPLRQDNMIIQSISLLDTLDKDINTFAMRVKEWYGWHFPELVRIVGDNYKCGPPRAPPIPPLPPFSSLLSLAAPRLSLLLCACPIARRVACPTPPKSSFSRLPSRSLLPSNILPLSTPTAPPDVHRARRSAAGAPARRGAGTRGWCRRWRCGRR